MRGQRGGNAACSRRAARSSVTWKERWSSSRRQKRKKCAQNTLCFSDCGLDLQVVQLVMSPRWRAQKSLNVGCGVAFVCRFLSGYFEFRDDKLRAGKSKSLDIPTVFSVWVAQATTLHCPLKLCFSRSTGTFHLVSSVFVKQVFTKTCW